MYFKIISLVITVLLHECKCEGGRRNELPEVQEIKQVPLEKNPICLDLCVCELTLSSIYKATNASFEENEKRAKSYAAKYLEWKTSKDQSINDKCRLHKEKCWKMVQLVARHSFDLPYKLAFGCSGHVIPYMLFLCDSNASGLEDWPAYYKNLIQSEGYKPCGHVCPKFSEYRVFHEENGKKYPADFPKTWANYTEQEDRLRLNKSEVEEEHLENRDRSEAILIEATKFPDVIKLDTIHTEVESDGSFTGMEKFMQCAKSTWATHISFNEPWNLGMICRNAYNNSNIHTLVTHTHRNIPQGCKHKKSLALPTGAYIIGLRLSEMKLSGLQYNKIVQYRCSGSDWFDMSRTDKVYQQELLCPHRTAICSIIYKEQHVRQEIRPLIVDIKIGCCEVPFYQYYSGLKLYPKDPVVINTDRLRDGLVGDNVNHDRYEIYVYLGNLWGDYDAAHKDTVTLVPTRTGVLQETTKSFLCAPGEFIVGIEQYVRVSNILRRSNHKPVPILESNFYCNNMEGDGRAKLLTKGLYDWLPDYQSPYLEPFERYTQPEDLQQANRWSSRMKVGRYIECKPGFAYAYRFSNYVRPGTNQDKIPSIRWEEMLFCSNDRSNSSEYRTWYADKYDIVNQTYSFCGLDLDYEPICQVDIGIQYDSEVLCPSDHGICGVEAKIRPASLENDNKYYNLISFQLYEFRFVCCPVIPVIVEEECRRGVVYDVVKPAITCPPLAGTDVECTVRSTQSVTTTSQVREEGAVNRNPWYVPSPLESYRIISKSVHKKLGDGFHDAADEIMKKTIRGKREGGKTSVFDAVTTILGLVGGFISAGSSTANTVLNYNKENAEEETAAALDKMNYITVDVTTIGNSTENSIKYTIRVGERPIFYDFILKCGRVKFKAREEIRVIVPSTVCTPEEGASYLSGELDALRTPNPKPYSLQMEANGFGVAIVNAHDDLNRLPWALVGEGISKLFERQKYTHIPLFNLRTADPRQFNKFNTSFTFVVSVSVPSGDIAGVYRIYEQCGSWRVWTDKFVLRTGPNIKLRNIDYTGDDWTNAKLTTLVPITRIRVQKARIFNLTLNVEDVNLIKGFLNTE